MNNNRREFLRQAAMVTMAFQGMASLNASTASASPEAKLLSDPDGIMDLLPGFSYSILSEKGQKMDDGLVVPNGPDGMAAFPGEKGRTILVRNHELNPGLDGPFGKKNELIKNFDESLIYDACGGRQGCGGTTTLVLSPDGRVEKQFLSLAGTIRNCAGGPTPWGSWISCEETTVMPKDDKKGRIEKEHGYCFEVPATENIECVKPVPLKAMGRFNHEAVAIDPDTGYAYLTEDRGDGLLYRFIPKVPGKLVEGGKLQALAIKEGVADSRNWKQNAVIQGKAMEVEWIDLDDVESPKDDLRKRGSAKGATLFTRGEGIWYGKDGIYFCCTNGGSARRGQIFRLRPQGKGKSDELVLLIEPNDQKVMASCDNLTVAPDGNLYVCEDRSGDTIRILKVSPEGVVETFANARTKSELAGACFAPDGKTLFVNIQWTGLTLAIKGPFS